MAAADGKRTVKAVVTTYVGTDGAPRVGLRGEQIEVATSDLKRFDQGESDIPALPKPDEK